MRKKATEEMIKEFISQCAEEINSQKDFDFRLATSRLERAEQELINTFTPEQKLLYEEYLQERQHYNDDFLQYQK